MSKTAVTLDHGPSIALPTEAVDALGVGEGAELEVEIIGRAVVLRSADEARRSRVFASAFDLSLTKRRSAYEELAKGTKH